ncbi:MAG TPA: EamA family transporter [Bryobacteraceae bacterium]|nr:EamA family transporter [Bryobacteraceae bacterium]
MAKNPQVLAYAALAAVCFFWGTTYLTIRMALESFPPMLLVCLRYLVSGAIMVTAALTGGARLPRGRELAGTSLTGLLILGVGNGCLVFAQQHIPSGLAGLILTISPFWMVGIEALMPNGERLHGPTIAGMTVGLAGAALLFAPGFEGRGVDAALLNGFLLLQLAMAGWSFGSIYQRRRSGRAHPVFAGAVQQLAAGLAYLPLVLLIPERPVEWHFRGVAALLYLIFFGSIVGYSAYAYALDRLPVAIVSIYPYVNAVVAVALGWLFYREPFGTRQAAAMLVIFAGVAMVKRYGPSRRSR